MLLVAGIGAAVAASLFFNAGLVLQALEARREPPSLSLRLSLLLVLVRRWRWLLGWFLGVAGVAPQVLALAIAPFVIVQPALTVGLLLVLGVGVSVLDERVGRWEWAGVVAIIAGVALVAVGAPGHTEEHRGGLVVLLVVAALLLVSLIPFATRGKRFDTPALTIVASGVGFAVTNIVTKLLSDDVGLGHYANAGAWLVVGVAAGLGATVTGMTAFQRAATTIVVPVTTAIQTFVPIVLEPLFLRERWSTAPLYGSVLAVGLAVSCAGAIVVSRSGGVGELVAAASAR